MDMVTPIDEGVHFYNADTAQLKNICTGSGFTGVGIKGQQCWVSAASPFLTTRCAGNCSIAPFKCMGRHCPVAPLCRETFRRGTVINQHEEAVSSVMQPHIASLTRFPDGSSSFSSPSLSSRCCTISIDIKRTNQKSALSVWFLEFIQRFHIQQLNLKLFP